ncbi:hypothetical protein M758_8G113300 [Ceratodon purpureus]|nr:hypothetical protein M758_8G113300 [Ceratodon purpureus]
MGQWQGKGMEGKLKLVLERMLSYRMQFLCGMWRCCVLLGLQLMVGLRWWCDNDHGRHAAMACSHKSIVSPCFFLCWVSTSGEKRVFSCFGNTRQLLTIGLQTC